MQILEDSRHMLTAPRWLSSLLPLLLIATSVFLAAPCAVAQTAMATISGRVTDQSNAVLPNADINIVKIDTRISTSAKTNAEGLYVFPSLQPGNYELTVSKTGFRSTTVRELKLDVQASVSQNVMLQIGSTIESITVDADPASEQLQGTSSELGTVIPEKAIQDLPLNGRNFTELLQLIPGVNPVSTSQSSGIGVNDLAVLAVPSATVAQPTFGGQFNRSNLYMLDGTLNTELNTSAYIIPPIADAIQEFKVQSHEDKAEYGGVLGGIVSVVTLSGTDKLHASAWEFVRNNIFDARDSFADEAGGVALAPSPYHQNQFGALVGGPVWIPKVYNGHNRTFFLFAYEGWRYNQVAESKFWVPTAAELAGDFSHSILQQQIYDPATTQPDPNNPGEYIRTPIPGNIIPADRLNPVSVNFIKAYFDPPNLTGDPLGNLLVSRPSINNSDHYMGRLDEQLGSKDSLFFRYDLLNVVSLSANSNTQSADNSVPATNFIIGWNHVFTPKLMMDNRYGQTRRPFARATSDSAGLSPMTGLGFASAGRHDALPVFALGQRRCQFGEYHRKPGQRSFRQSDLAPRTTQLQIRLAIHQPGQYLHQPPVWQLQFYKRYNRQSGECGQHRQLSRVRLSRIAFLGQQCKLVYPHQPLFHLGRLWPGFVERKQGRDCHLWVSPRPSAPIRSRLDDLCERPQYRRHLLDGVERVASRLRRNRADSLYPRWTRKRSL